MMRYPSSTVTIEAYIYMAKHQGRNCVAMLTPPGAEAVAQKK